MAEFLTNQLATMFTLENAWKSSLRESASGELLRIWKFSKINTLPISTIEYD